MGVSDAAVGRDAAAHVAVRVPRAGPGDRAGDVRSSLAGERFDCADDIAVLDGERIVGLLPIERLLAAPAGAQVGCIMDPEPPVVAPGHDQEAVAWEMVRRGESSVAVEDGAGRFVGLVPPHRMIEVLLAEHDEDVARLAGYLSRAGQARQAAEEPLLRRLWHRLPWLAIGLAGAMLSAVFVGAFEADLEENVLLAIFIPAVVYMADAVGTQTEAVLIRGMAAGVDLRVVVLREAGTGAVLGLLAGRGLPPVRVARVGRRAGSDRRRACAVRRLRDGDRRGDGVAVAAVAQRSRSRVRLGAARHRGPGPAVDPHLLPGGERGGVVDGLSQ